MLASASARSSCSPRSAPTQPRRTCGLLSVSAGLTTSYRVFNGFGFYLEPELVVLVPMGAGNKMSWGLDLAGGVEISF